MRIGFKYRAHALLKHFSFSFFLTHQVVVSGKLRAQRAKTMKFIDGYLKSSGDPTNYYIDSAIRHMYMRQGVLGLRIKILLPHDPTGRSGPKQRMPDKVTIIEPKEEKVIKSTPPPYFNFGMIDCSYQTNLSVQDNLFQSYHDHFSLKH